MSWVNLGDHHKVDVLAHKGLRLIKSANVNKYYWMATEIVGTSFVLNTIEVVTQADITVGNSPYWAILLIDSDEMVCGSFEGCSISMYKCFSPGRGCVWPSLILKWS